MNFLRSFFLVDCSWKSDLAAWFFLFPVIWATWEMSCVAVLVCKMLGVQLLGRTLPEQVLNLITKPIWPFQFPCIFLNFRTKWCSISSFVWLIWHIIWTLQEAARIEFLLLTLSTRARLHYPCLLYFLLSWK